MVGASHIINVVLNVSGIRRRPPWVSRWGQIMRCILPEGLLASRKTRRWVVGAWGRRCIMGIPQQVYIKGILQDHRKRLQIDMYFNNTLTICINWKKNKQKYTNKLNLSQSVVTHCQLHFNTIVVLSNTIGKIVFDSIWPIVQMFSSTQSFIKYSTSTLPAPTLSKQHPFYLDYRMVQTSSLDLWSLKPYLVLLTPSLFIIVENIVTDVVFWFPDKQTCSFLDMVASSIGGHCHSQEQQHCNQRETKF